MFQSLKSRLLQSAFFKNVVTLASGTTLAHIVLFLTSPILYRIYDKGDYGLLGLYMSITAVLNVFSTLAYTKCVLIEQDVVLAKASIWLVRVINFCFAFLILLIAIIFGDQIASLMNTPDIAKWLYLLPVSLFFTAQNEIFKAWANRTKQYKLISFNTILISLSVPAVSIPFGFLYPGPNGLFVGLVISQVIPSVYLFYKLSRSESFGFQFFDVQKLKTLAITYKSFPLYNLPSEFINQFTNQLPVFMLGTYTNIGVVGMYNLCVRMLATPINLIGNSISMVYKQKAIDEYNSKGEFTKLFLGTAKVLSLISIIPLIVLLLFGTELFGFVFGEEWTEAGLIAQLLSGMFVAKFIVSPLTYAFIIRNKLREDMLWHIWMFISNILIFFIGFKMTQNYLMILFIFGLNYMSIYLIYFFRSLKFSKHD